MKRVFFLLAFLSMYYDAFRSTLTYLKAQLKQLPFFLVQSLNRKVGVNFKVIDGLNSERRINYSSWMNIFSLATRD